MSGAVQQFVNGLKSRHRDVQNKAVQDLINYVKTELREMPQDDLKQFFDTFNHHIFDMVNSPDSNEKKGGVLAIKCLISGDVVNTTTRISRYSQNLRNLLPSNDVGVMELAAKTLVKLALLPGSKGSESFEFDIKRAFEWLTEERVENKRHAAVLILRELAVAMPTFFYQQISNFFGHIFNALNDPKPSIRECAGEALRAALIVTSQRESVSSENKQHWYRQCYDEAIKSFGEVPPKERGVTRDDRIHGGLIVLNEILRCSNLTWEREYMELKRLRPETKQFSSEESGNYLFPRFKVPFTDKRSPAKSISHAFECQKFSRQINVLQESAHCRQLVTENYDKICTKVFDQRLSRSPHIQQMIMGILPRLAAFNPVSFNKKLLKNTVNHLIGTLKGKEKDKNIAFLTIGYIAVAVSTDMEPYTPRIMELVKTTLPSREPSSKRKLIDYSVFDCVALLSYAVKGTIMAEVKEILEPMFATGLSPSLVVCMREVSENIPQLKRDISEGLIKMLNVVLMAKPCSHIGTPKHGPIAQIAALTIADTQPDTQIIVLGLKTLATFNFEGQHLLPFVQQCANYYLNHEQQEVRLEAVITCCRLLQVSIHSADEEGVSESLKETVMSVLEKLLSVAITDTEPSVRLQVLRSLDQSFDPQLAQPWFLSSLLITMNDEVFEIRELAVKIIGRLSTLNPAYVMPNLRKTLVQLLTELEHSGMSRNKEQSARMLDHLIVNTPRLISSYMRPVLTTLVPKLREADSNPGVILNILRAIGDLAELNCGSNVMDQWSDELLSILIEMLSDAGAPNKREVALWTLGQVVSATGQVVVPYHKYPGLIDVLINFLKTETHPFVRRETIRVLGLLGALDPYKHKMNRGLIDNKNETLLISTDTKGDEIVDLSTAEMLVNMNHMLEEYYPAVAIATLMRILKDPTLAQHHTNVVQAITFIFNSLGIKSREFLSQVVPVFLSNIRSADINSRNFLFQQLSSLIEIVKYHIIYYMDEVFKLVKEFWTPNGQLQATLINLVEKIAVALGCEFRTYLAELMPQILKVLAHDPTKERSTNQIKLLMALQKFGNNLDDYLHLVVPPIVKLFEPNDILPSVCGAALDTINHLAESLDFTDYSSRIIHPLVRVIDNHPELRDKALQALCSLMVQLGKKFLVFVPLVNRVIVKHRITCSDYTKILTRLQSTTTLCIDDEFRLRQQKFRCREQSIRVADNTRKFKVSGTDLQKLWQAARRVSKDDWVEWLRHLSAGLLKESPSPALRSCRSLAQNYPQLLRDLFNAAFVSCWTELNEDMKRELSENLKQALMVTDLPEVTQAILNLAEFMEHCDRDALPIEIKLLGDRAAECRAYAKALHYKEEEFQKEKTPQVYEALMLINNKLQQKEAAEGLLEYLIANRGTSDEMQVQVRWYEKLHNWDKALTLYKEKLQVNSNDTEAYLGQMRCLEALGEWGSLDATVRDKWDDMSHGVKSSMGGLAATAAWSLQDWEQMKKYVECIPEDTQDGCFYRAVLAVHNGNFEYAQRLIDDTRDLLDTDLTAMAGESYERAYIAMVCVQMLAELEEVIQYKLIPERRQIIRNMWWKRLQGGQRLVEDWQRIIRVHSLVVSPEEDVHTLIKFASLCRKNSSYKLSHKTLTMLLGTDPSLNPDAHIPGHQPHVAFAYCKHLWMDGERDKEGYFDKEMDRGTEKFKGMRYAYEKLDFFVNHYSLQHNVTAEEIKEDNRRLLARCNMKLGSWQYRLEGLTKSTKNGILEYYEKATKYDPHWYKAWHSYAYMYFKILQSPRQDSLTFDGTKDLTADYAVRAVNGFFRSINLSQGNSLQDTLRILTLLFDYAQLQSVFKALVEGMHMIEINTWLQVIPQLIARIDTTRETVGPLIHQLLIDIGKAHPQALVYPLTVASKSSTVARKAAAHKIMASMREHSSTLVEQALMCSEELIRVAILWHEQWHEGLEEASRLFFGDRNIQGMLDTLKPLHAMLERGPQTLKETSFTQAYGRDLAQALEWCKHYKASNNTRDLNQAWDLYYHVFRRISRQLPQLTSLELQYVSPKLLECHDLELAVPGSYVPGQELIRISSIQTNLQVITSKQRPRKLCIHGSNGKNYMFLLKGHEDLRQDERVMQLFGLVNTLLVNDPITFRRNLTIQKYAVIPLSTNSGLIGWVPHCDTLHTLIRDYREKKKTMLSIEHRLMLRMAPDYEHTTLAQKCEVFIYALELTQGDDLARLLWLKSPSSEVWFERRTNYTRSLAVMSMVGYILGLGDRHPSNLMLDRLSGKILHIDFGDCFEVAMNREKFPEKIPFRLTRMLINAMEVTGIEGTYRRTCESVMSVLRRNKDSLMAVLEAFVYDPLLNWRLMDHVVERPQRSPEDVADSYSGSGDETIAMDPISFKDRSEHCISKLETADKATQETTNAKAQFIIARVKQKLTGTDFNNPKDPISVQRQVDFLILEATRKDNLCQCYIGWCPFW